MRRVSCILICASLALLGFSFLSEAQTLPTSYTAGSYTTCLLLDTVNGKLYIGTHTSPNLYVYDLVDGEPSGVPENYSAGSFTFDLALNLAHNKLYIGNGAAESNLWVYDLVDGEPTGAPRSYTAGNYVNCLTLNAANDKLYVGTYTTENNIRVYDLVNGEPAGEPRGYTAGGNTTVLVLNSTFSKLYIGNDTDGPSLWVYDLDGNGKPTGTPRSYSAGSNTYDIVINPTHDKLYLGNSTPSPSLWVYDLNGTGEPSGAPRSYSVGDSTSALALDAAGGKIYIGNYTGESNVWAYDLTDGEPTGTPRSYSAGRDTYALALDAAREKLYIGNYTETLNLWAYYMYVPPPEAPSAPILDGLPALTNQPSLTVTGTTDPNLSVKIYVGENITSTTAGADGRFSAVVGLAEGANTIAATATNEAGTSQASPAQVVTLDTVPPSEPTVYQLPATISLSQLEVTGTAEPGSIVRVYIDNRVAGTAAATENGFFSATVILSEGANPITARATDAAGNTGPPSIAQTVQYTRPAWAPPTPSLDPLPFLVNESELTIRGSGLAGLIIQAYVDAEPVENTTARIDNSFSLTVELAEGPNVINAVAWDLLGNPSGASAAQTVIVDTAMVAPIIQTIENLPAGENGVMEFGENLPIYEIKVTAAEKVENLSVGAGELKDRDGDGIPDPPAGISTPAGVVIHSYIRFHFLTDVGEAVESVAFENVGIDFRVPQAWVQQNGIDENTIKLLRYDNAWVPLEIEIIGENEGYMHLRARTTGLSIFAIVGEKIPAPRAVPLWLYLVVVSLIAVAVAAAVVWRRRVARVARGRRPQRKLRRHKGPRRRK